MSVCCSHCNKPIGDDINFCSKCGMMAHKECDCNPKSLDLHLQSFADIYSDPSKEVLHN